jgi:hypothetical protein
LLIAVAAAKIVECKTQASCGDANLGRQAAHSEGVHEEMCVVEKLAGVAAAAGPPAPAPPARRAGGAAAPVPSRASFFIDTQPFYLDHSQPLQRYG